LLDNRQYHRSFIILKSQDSGFSLDDRKEAAGYCKMEIRNNQGKIMLYVQDMKPVSPRQGIYDVMLLSSRDEVAPAKLTSIQVPDSGRGEYEITFDPDSVRETGTPIDQFHAFAIVYRPLKEGQALQYPLIGYSDKRVEMDWPGAVTEELEHFYGQKAPGRYAGPGPKPKEMPQEGGLLSVPGKTHEKKKSVSRPDIGAPSDGRNPSGANEIPGGDGRQSESTYSGSKGPGTIASAHRRAARKKAEEEEAARRKAEEEEAARRKAEQEEAARRKAEQEEAARKKAEQEEAARRKAEQEEAAWKKAEQEEAARKKAEEEEAARRKAEQEEAAWKKAEEKEVARRKAEQEEASLELPNFDPPDISYIYDRKEEQETETDLPEENVPEENVPEENVPGEDMLEEDTFDEDSSKDAPDENSFCNRDEDISSLDTNGTEETGYAEGLAYNNAMGEPVPPMNPAGSYPKGMSYWDQTKDYFSQLFQNNTSVCPFDYTPETEWVRVEDPNPSPYSCYGMGNYGGSGDTDHYLVGLARHREKVRYVIYGVPGIYSMVPPRSMQGYSRWLPVKNGYGAGYWLLYIDAISGNVAYPW